MLIPSPASLPIKAIRWLAGLAHFWPTYSVSLPCRVAEENCSLIEVVEAIRPHLQLTFENILSHINTIYVLQTRQGAMSSRHEQRFLRLKVSEFCGLFVVFVFGLCLVVSLCSALISICNRTDTHTHTQANTGSIMK